MSKRDEYYSRIEKITGNHLLGKTIAVRNAPFVSKAVELLASCGLLGFTFRDLNNAGDFLANVWATHVGKQFEDVLMHELKKHNQFEDRWNFSFGAFMGSEELILAGGSYADCISAWKEAKEKRIPAIVGVLLENGTSSMAVVLPDDKSFPMSCWRSRTTEVTPDRYFDWIDLNNQMANIAKAMLLSGTAWERGDINSLLRFGKRALALAHPDWPWVNRYVKMDDSEQAQWFERMCISLHAMRDEHDLCGKKVLIVGLGSLGSIVAEHFRVLGCSVVGIDGKGVSIHNPVRQLYATSDIGESKAFALARTLARSHEDYAHSRSEDAVSFSGEKTSFVGLLTEIPDSRIGSQRFIEILERHAPDLVILSTAHPAEYRMANICQQKNIPHVIGKCYNRARWFEVTVVNGNQGPCFGCLQGHLYKGAHPSLTEEQLARYDMAGDEANAVQAEPATRVDTSRCADTMARFGAALLQSDRARVPWLSRMFSEERTCLIGGNYAEYLRDTDEWSFGVTAPGGVALYGVINFIGSETENEKTCLYCGKTHEVLIKRKTFQSE